ncbi:MAG TPA: hypothetical protein VHP14_13545, partial [Anaerolineales bacterium]|nr:hypothetical protein [Anaerolineales bacterium]
MTHPIQQHVLDILQGGWAEYVEKFHRLSPEARSAFLARQGYARFIDLLAHITAWWQVGYQSIERYLIDPAAQPREYDVDAFNARAVADVAGLDEAHILGSFEKMRSFLVDFVKNLPETAFEDKRVVNQLNMEFTGHLGEHK